jgi:integrase
LAPCGPLDVGSVALTWSAARRKMVVYRYGQWLNWLALRGILDPEAAPAARLIPERVAQYVGALGELVAPQSVWMQVDGLFAFMRATQPEHDWTWLRRIVGRLKVNAPPSKNKRTRVVPTLDLFNLGVSLMENPGRRGGAKTVRIATRFRDGLIIALLAARPIRLGNLEMIEIDRHIVFERGRYWLRFAVEETKTSRAIDEPCPDALTAYIARYVDHVRPYLLTLCSDRREAETRRLWINRHGRPMAWHAIHEQIKYQTQLELGVAINPHLFRDCLATSVAIEDPDHVRVAAAMLGHATLATTNRYYNQATSIEAGRALSRQVAQRRLLAKARAAEDLAPSDSLSSPMTKAR